MSFLTPSESSSLSSESSDFYLWDYNQQGPEQYLRPATYKAPLRKRKCCLQRPLVLFGSNNLNDVAEFAAKRPESTMVLFLNG